MSLEATGQILIAATVAYVAWQDFRINKANHRLQRDKLRLDLFDRRLQVFSACQRLTSFVVMEGKPTREELYKFNRDSSEAEFLFGKEIESFISEIDKKGLRLIHITEQLKNGAFEMQQREKLVNESDELFSWFMEQFTNSKKLFRKYLHISIGSSSVNMNSNNGMPKLNIDIANKWFSAAAGFAVIIGVIGGLWQLHEMVVQTKLQNETLTHTQEVDSANYILQMDQKLSQGKYNNIANVIDGSVQSTPIIWASDGGSGGPFSSNDVSDYIGWLDDIGLLVQDHVISSDMAYNDFSYDVEKAWCNKDVRNMVISTQKGDTAPSASSTPYYGYFEKLALSSLATDKEDCKWVDTQ